MPPELPPRLRATGVQTGVLSSITVPVEQEIQHLLGGGEGAVGAEEDGDVGGVFAPERRHHVLHQPLQRPGLDGSHLAGLVEAQGRVRLHAQPPLPLTGRLVKLHLPQRDGEDGVLLGLLADLLRRALRRGGDRACCETFFPHL